MATTALSLRKWVSAFLDGPALTTRSAPVGRPGAMFGSLLDRWGKLTPNGSGDTFDTDSAYRLAMTSAWAASAMDLRAKALSGKDARPQMAQRDADGTQPIQNHPFTALLERPNSLMSGGFLLRYVSTWLDLRGNAYLFVSTPAVGRGDPVELWPLQADLVRPLPGTLRDGVGLFRGQLVLDYEYNIAGALAVLPGENVIHFRTPNPFDFWEGLAPLAAAALGIDLDYSQRVWQRDFFKEDNAIPSSIVSMPAEMSEYDFETVIARLKDDLDNGRKRLFTRAGDIKVEVIAQTLEQMQIVESREFSRKEIDRVFGIPDGLMSGGLSGDSRLAAEIAFARHTTQPQLDYIAEQMNADLVRYYGDPNTLVIEAPNIIPQDRALEVQEYTIYSQERTVNENREARGEKKWMPPDGLSDLAPLADVPVRLIDMAAAKLNPPPAPVLPGQAPGEDAPGVGAMAGSQDPEAETDEQAGKSAAWKAEAKQFRKWARGKHDPDPAAFKAALLTPADKAALLVEKAEAATEQPPFALPSTITPEWVGATKATLQLDPDDDEAEQQIREEIERRMERELAAALREQLGELIPDGADNAAVAAAPGRVTETGGRVRDVLRRHLQMSADLGVSVAVDQLGAIGFDWTLANQDAAAWVQQYTFDLVGGIHNTSRARLQLAVNEWIQNGDPLPELVRELTPTFGRQRARMIAQTETTRAYAEANTAAYRRSGVVSKVEWRTARDEAVCPVCGPLHGTQAALGGTFGGYSPPAHPRCRCWIVPMVGE